MKKVTDKTQQKVIFHVDVNSAFLSWSAVKRLKEDPNALDLRTVPAVVAGDIETRHGIVTAKSIPAKKYGIRTAEPVAQALRKCPGLITIKSDFETYREYSHAFIDILRTYSDSVEQVSIDEAYMDMTERAADPSEAVRLAEQLKAEVRDSLGFTVNVGISSNKLLAKTASDFTKPDKVHTLWPEEVPSKLWPLPIGELHGCGGATAGKLRSIGIETVRDAAETDISVLKSLLGNKGGDYIARSSRGLGSDVIHAESEEAKGYSGELTTEEDVTAQNYEKKVPEYLRREAERVARRMQRDGVFASTIGVMVKTNQFRRRSRQTTLSESTNAADVLAATAAKLLDELALTEGGLFDQGDSIRLIGISATKLDRGEYRQMNLFDYGKSVAEEKRKLQEELARKKAEAEAALEEKRRAAAAFERTQEKEKQRAKLDAMMLKVRGKYGENAISKGIDPKPSKG